MSSEISNTVLLLMLIMPAPSKGWCLNPKGLGNGITIHPFGTPRRGQVSLFDDRWKVEGKDFHLGIGSNWFLVCFL